MTAVEREILRLERQQVADFNRYDLKGLLKQFERGFVGFSSTRYKRIAGRAAMKRTFEHYLDQSPRVRYRIAEPRVQLFDETSVVGFYWGVELSPRHRVAGRGSHVMIKHGNQWRIVHEHFSRSR